jgi:hypothetical protein
MKTRAREFNFHSRTRTSYWDTSRFTRELTIFRSRQILNSWVEKIFSYATI